MGWSRREFVEIVGIVSVVASLLFVGAQLYFDRRVAMGTQFHERMVLGHDAYLSRSENEAWIAAEAKKWENGFKPGFWGPELKTYRQAMGLTMEDMVREEQLARATLVRYNNNYYQLTQGLLPESYGDELENAMAYQMENDPVMRAVALNFPVLEDGFEAVIFAVESQLQSGQGQAAAE